MACLIVCTKTSCIFKVMGLAENLIEITVDRLRTFCSSSVISAGLKNLASLVLLKIRCKVVKSTLWSCFLVKVSGTLLKMTAWPVKIFTASLPEMWMNLEVRLKFKTALIIICSHSKGDPNPPPPVLLHFVY